LKVSALRSLVASIAVVIALFVAAVPAHAKPGNGNGQKPQHGPTAESLSDYYCALFFPGQNCFSFSLS